MTNTRKAKGRSADIGGFFTETLSRVVLMPIDYTFVSNEYYT